MAPTFIMDQDSLQALGEGLQRYTVENDAVVVYKLTSVKQTIIDLAEQDIRQRLQACGTTRPCLMMIDVSELEFLATNYMRDRIDELNTLHPEVRGRVAYWFSRNPMTMTLQFFIRLLHSVNRPKRVFFNNDDAIRWLLEEVQNIANEKHLCG